MPISVPNLMMIVNPKAMGASNRPTSNRTKDHPDYVGQCEGCYGLLFRGERGLQCDDGPVLCLKCCPTWADAKRGWESEHSEFDAEYRQELAERYDAHIAAGGSPDDQYAFPL